MMNQVNQTAPSFGEIMRERDAYRAQVTRQAALLKQCKEALLSYFEDGYTKVLHDLYAAIEDFEK